MRTVLIFALFTAPLFGQSRGGAQNHPSMAPPPAPRIHANPPAAPRPTPVARPPYTAPRPVLARPVFVPYPVFVGGGYAYAPAPDSGYVNPSPVGIVNPDYRQDVVNPTILDFSNAPQAEPVSSDENGLRDDEPTVFLIALTDHTVVAAIAYWAEGDTLNWVSRDAKQNLMSLSLVDREFSKQLNDERHVEFKLPPAK